MKSCVSLPNNKFRPLWYIVRRNKTRNCMMKYQPTFWQNTKPEVTPSVLKHAYLIMKPTSKLSLCNRPGGIVVFLQNNTDMLTFIL